MAITSKATPALPADELTSKLALPWILRLRYGLMATELAILGLAIWVAHAVVPLLPAAIVIAMTPASNVAERSLRKMGVAADRLIAGLFCLDILCLTAILMLTGGASNPFSLLYLVQITLSATILSKRWTWFLGLLSIVCFGSIFQWYLPIPQLEGHHVSEGRDLHLVGMWIGFAVAAFLIALFSGKISEELRAREGQLLFLEQQLAAKQRLASLATLAAGAAHELSTPLATIAVVAKELEHFATQVSENEAVADDSRLIRSEVERCRLILQGMSAQGAEFPGEPPLSLTAHDVLRRLREHLPVELLQRAEMRAVEPIKMTVPAQALIQSLSALLKNAADASGHGPITLDISHKNGRVLFAVRDEGPGMADDVSKRVGEPFFTTKPPGKGMGLGTFLVRTFAEFAGGSLKFDSVPGHGTTALLEISADGIERESFASSRQ
jgi:two-component system, sensor histidine kinase RegB